MTEKKNDKNMKRLIGKDVVTLASKIHGAGSVMQRISRSYWHCLENWWMTEIQS